MPLPTMSYSILDNAEFPRSILIYNVEFPYKNKEKISYQLLNDIFTFTIIYCNEHANNYIQVHSEENTDKT